MEDAFSRHRAFLSPSISAPSFPTFASPSSSRGPRRSYGGAGEESAAGVRGSAFASGGGDRRITSTPSFQYNFRAAAALVPAAAFLLDLGGTVVIAALAVGLSLAYLFDALKYKQASFFSVWAALIAANIAFLFTASLASLSFSSTPLIAVALLLCGLVTFIIGCWVSLQFRHIVIENLSVVTALERVLFACIPVTIPAVLTWAVISAAGMANAAYYLAAFAGLFYWVFAIPKASSFKTRKPDAALGGDATDGILGPLECCFQTLYLLFAPLFFHAAAHHRSLLSSPSSVCDLFLLFFMPLLFQLYASTRGALWWVTRDQQKLHKLRIVNGAIALVVIIVCLEVRVVFRSLGRYIHVPPPLNYVLVTVTMLGGAMGMGAYAVGMVGDAVSSVVFTTLSVLVSGAGAIVIGFPKMLIVLPMISGYYLARFFTKKSISSYFTFVALASMMVLWFVVHNYWDLNIWIAGMPLKHFSKYVVAAVIMAMSVPGLALLPSNLRFITELGLICHALLLCYIEDRLFNYATMYYFGFEEEVMYPNYMVMATTLLGLALVRRLYVDQRIGSKAVWILTCLYCSKLPMLFITTRSVLWVSAVLFLAVSPPLLLYRDKSKGTSRMMVWQAYFHACVVAISAWLCRETIFESLQWFHGRPPSDGLLLGSYIILSGIACIPIVAIHFSHNQTAKRVLVLVIATGILFAVLQPPMTLSLVYRSDLIKSAHQSNDDISIYGFTAPKPTWPSWLLIATVVHSLAAATSIIPVKFVVELRALYALVVGITLGIYLCVQYFFQSIILYPLLVATTVCASFFVVFTHLPSASSTKLLPWVFSFLVVLFPVTYMIEGQLRVRSLVEGEEVDQFASMLVVEGARMSLLGLYAMLFMLIALEIKFELASLLREKGLDRGILHDHPGQSSVFQPKSRLLQQRRAHAAPSFTIKRLATEAAWMPLVGNVSTVICFIICLILNISLTGGSNRAIFLLAPILLLLNQDSDIFSGFGDRQRYFPVTAAISIYLVITAVYRIWEESWPGDSGWGLDIGSPGWIFAVKNLALLILTMPNHILFNRFMWDYVKQTDGVLLLTLPLNLPAILMPDVLTIRVLGLLGIIYSLAQYLISRRIRIAGMRYI